MSYSKDLAKRLRTKPTPRASTDRSSLPVPPHPQKYPDHPGVKGSMYDGECNRTACGAPHATMFNIGTRGYYCVPCGRAINGANNNRICVEVAGDLTHEQMDYYYQEQMRLGW